MKRLLHALAILATLTITLSAHNRVWADGGEPWPKTTTCLPLTTH
jgi:hypothetical protein